MNLIEVSVLRKYAIECYLCSKTPPIAIPLTSVYNSKCSARFGGPKIGALVRAIFRVSNSANYFSPHSHVVSFQRIANRGAGI